MFFYYFVLTVTLKLFLLGYFEPLFLSKSGWWKFILLLQVLNGIHIRMVEHISMFAMFKMAITSYWLSSVLCSRDKQTLDGGLRAISHVFIHRLLCI